MSRSLNILAVGGWHIQVGDDSPYWKLMAAVDELPDTTVTEQAWDTLQDDDILGKDIVICYSWGCASVFKAFDRLKDRMAQSPLPLLIIMAGVPRGIGQRLSVGWKGGWSVPDTVKVAVCLQVESFPTSYPIANSGATRINRLLTNLPGLDHVSIEDAEETHQFVVGLVRNIQSAR